MWPIMFKIYADYVEVDEDSLNNLMPRLHHHHYGCLGALFRSLYKDAMKMVSCTTSPASIATPNSVASLLALF